ncbi:MAG: fumarylacetoacetate hydrolase family protein [Alphaproteobacteria bacterium]|nr:fumarylacetoacetate hydrolase family protein [Alphaproteobacteria bacterium]
MRDEDGAAIVEAILDARRSGRQIAPPSRRHPDLSLADAYRLTLAIRRAREAGGERVVGRKIGFTNRTIWQEYGVHGPVWGYVYDRTLHELAALNGTFPLAGLIEPRIEPEIAFHFARAPEPDIDAQTLLDCIDWYAHGFEIVQSLFPDWKFAAPDTVAAFGLHGALLLGGRIRPAAAHRHELARQFEGFEIDLSRNGEQVDHGRAANVLDGPLHALGALLRLLRSDPHNPPLAAGEIVTTGTLTRAFPVRPGETWSTRLHDIEVEGISVRFR